MAFSSSYENGVMYEIFVRRAYRVHQGTPRNGGQSHYMKNLIETENGADLSRLVGSYDKQLGQVKLFLEKAIDKFLKMRLNESEKQELGRLRQELSQCYSSSELVDIVDKGLEATQRFKDF